MAEENKIEKKGAKTLQRQGLGYAKLETKDEEEKELIKDSEKIEPKKHEIYDATYYIPFNKTRIVGIYSSIITHRIPDYR